MVEFIRAPRVLPPRATYRTSPRKRATFNTFLDANDLFDASSAKRSTVEVTRPTPQTVAVTAEHPFRDGLIRERLVCEDVGGTLRSAELERTVFDLEGAQKRTEKVDFRGPLPLPPDSYPEVLLPFLLRWQRFDHKERAVYAWINDRFVVRVYYHRIGETTLDLPIGRREAAEFIMYPDLNDWVKLGSLLTRLARPFVPKYRMWFDPAPPHHVLKFEGPYGPPGAPEIVLELEEG